MECVESGRRREDVAPVHWRVHQAGVHRWRPGLSTELQRPVRPEDMVRAAQAVDVPVELVGATGVAGRATAQVRRAWANREGETLDERGVQGLGIRRLPQRRLQPTRRADPPAPFDSDDAIVPPSLEHVTIDARRPKEALNHPNVVLQPIGRDQRESHHASAEDDVVEDGRGVSRGAAAEHAPGPQSGTHLDGRTQPCGSTLVADERAERISLQLNDFEVAQHPLVEALRRCRGPLEPSRDGMAGMARDPGGRRTAHTLDAQARDLVEFPTSAAKAAVRCPRVRAARSPADRAAVPPASAPLRRKRAGAHDGEAQFSGSSPFRVQRLSALWPMVCDHRLSDGGPGRAIRASLDGPRVGSALTRGRRRAGPPSKSGARAGGLRRTSRSSVLLTETPLFSLGCSYSKNL